MRSSLVLFLALATAGCSAYPVIAVLPLPRIDPGPLHVLVPVDETGLLAESDRLYLREAVANGASRSFPAASGAEDAAFRLRITVREWSEGSFALRLIVGLGAGVPAYGLDADLLDGAGSGINRLHLYRNGLQDRRMTEAENTREVMLQDAAFQVSRFIRRHAR